MGSLNETRLKAGDLPKHPRPDVGTKADEYEEDDEDLVLWRLCNYVAVSCGAWCCKGGGGVETAMAVRNPAKLKNVCTYQLN